RGHIRLRVQSPAEKDHESRRSKITGEDRGRRLRSRIHLRTDKRKTATSSGIASWYEANFEHPLVCGAGEMDESRGDGNRRAIQKVAKIRKRGVETGETT